MFRSRFRPFKSHHAQSVSRKARRSTVRLHVERLEDRLAPAGTVTITAVQGTDTLSATVPVATEGQSANPSINATFTDTNAVTPANLTVTVDYGDGTAFSSNQAGANFDPNLLVTQVGGAGGTTYTVTDQHTFPEESGSTVPPFAFTITLTVTETATPANTDTRNTTAQVLDAALSPLVREHPSPASVALTRAPHLAVPTRPCIVSRQPSGASRTLPPLRRPAVSGSLTGTASRRTAPIASPAPTAPRSSRATRSASRSTVSRDRASFLALSTR